MKKILSAALIFCLALTPVFALAEKTLSVQGSATVTVAPDCAFVYVGYSCENIDSSQAQKETSDVIEKIVDAVLDLGIEEGEIVTSYINIYPVYNYNESTTSLREYRIEHMLSITVGNLELVGNVLDIALDVGANQVGGITYATSKEMEIYIEALALAVDNAISKADALARASGVWLGGLVEINEQSYSYARYAVESVSDAEATGASIGSTLRTGTLNISATVEMVYEIR